LISDLNSIRIITSNLPFHRSLSFDYWSSTYTNESLKCSQREQIINVRIIRIYLWSQMIHRKKKKLVFCL